MESLPEGDHRVNVDDDEVFLELCTSSQQLAGGIDNEAMTVEDELVLPAHGVAERDEARVVCGALRQHPFTFDALAPVIWRSREVDN